MLTEADQRKNEFLATLAHELRNPLAPIRFALETLKGGSPPVTAARARDVIDRQVDVLGDDRQRLRRPGAGRFGDQRVFHRRADVGRQIRRGPDDQMQDAVEK